MILCYSLNAARLLRCQIAQRLFDLYFLIIEGLEYKCRGRSSIFKGYCSVAEMNKSNDARVCTQMEGVGTNFTMDDAGLVGGLETMCGLNCEPLCC